MSQMSDRPKPGPLGQAHRSQPDPLTAAFTQLAESIGRLAETAGRQEVAIDRLATAVERLLETRLNIDGGEVPALSPEVQLALDIVRSTAASQVKSFKEAGKTDPDVILASVIEVTSGIPGRHLLDDDQFNQALTDGFNEFRNGV